MSAGEIAAIVSALAAVAATWFAWVSAQAAKRSAMLTERQLSSQEPNLQLYLRDARMYRLRAHDTRLYEVMLRIMNLAGATNSVAELRLEIDYRREMQRLTPLQVPHDAACAALIPEVEPTLIIPLRLEPVSVAQGRALFRVPASLLADAYVDRCSVVAVDAHGSTSSVTFISLREHEYA